MTPEGLPQAALDAAREAAESAPPPSAALRADLRLIIWGPATAAPDVAA